MENKRRGRPPVPLADRFWSRVQKADGCWLWTGTVNRHGYGQISSGASRRTLLAPRVSWELANGPIPDGLCVLHRCDIPGCVRPEHLFLGTKADNVRDMTAKARQAVGEQHGRRTRPERTARGEQQGLAKLTDETVREARARYAAGGVSFPTLARDYGVSLRAIWLAVRRRTWTHID